ncbi:MAG: apolipoprotein N-acyltransferase, partial [Candidatus Omnitrophica bacterium]|nr:apolipoprotein N-acyltransferase [Candidatus Omnitrophota bacterium]
MRWEFLWSALSGILLTLSYPVFNFEFFAFFSFVPLFLAVKNATLKKAFFLSYISGLVFFIVTIYWLIHVTLLGLILLVLYLSLYFGVFGIFLKLLTPDSKFQAIITIPAVWVLLEWLRSILLSGFGWALLGYSQYLNLPVIQIADITGVWGVSFLVMMVNVGIWRLIAEKRKKEILVSMICLLIVLGYGYFKLSRRIDGKVLKISVIQGNVPQHEKWDERFKEEILARYETLTKKAAMETPDLILWPETALPGIVDEEPQLLELVLKIAKDVKIPMLVGAVTREGANYYNSAILISEKGKIIGRYDKLHLVPFGEYVPFEKYYPYLRTLIGVPIGDFVAGKEYAVLKTEDLNEFSVLICFEDIIPVLSRRFVERGAKFLVNITNDGWFMRSSAPYQHAQASVFRAVEN